ncbi:MAG: DNA primase [Bilophila sp.]
MSQRNSRAIQEIKARLNLADIARRYVELRRNGARWVAPCPFHQETKPSFSINEEEGFFYCFGCQASGDLFDFYGKINGLDFRETLEQLAEEAGVPLERMERGGQGEKGNGQGEQTVSRRRQLLKIHEIAAAHFTGNLAGATGKECREYMARRGISEEVAAKFGLGWSQREWQALADALRRAGFREELGVEAALLGKSERGRGYDRFRGRLMFPIRSLSGNVIAFGGRIIGDEDEAKYINSSDSLLYKKGDHLYGLQQARRTIATGKPAMLTEGYMDVVTLHQFGYENAVGVLGTAFTPEQVKRISGFTSQVELLFDGDRAGRKAALRACEMLLTRGLSCKVVLFPEGEDIDSLLRTQGPEAFETLRTNAPEGMAFCVRTLRDMAPREAVDWARDFLKQVALPELVSRFASTLSTGLGLAENELRERVVESRAAQSLSGSYGAHKDPRATPPAKANPRDREVMTFAVRYPGALPRLQELGAHLTLVSEWARKLWDKLENFSADEVVQQLDAREKNFWIRCRTGDVPPLDNEEGEFDAIRTMLDTLHLTTQSASVSAALRQGAGAGDFEADLEYLRALQETLERTHGEQH